MKSKKEFILQSLSVPHKRITVTVESINGHLCISPKGYGDKYSKKGEGCPIMLDFYNDKLQLFAWDDINKDDPSHVISMENAKESNRIKE